MNYTIFEEADITVRDTIQTFVKEEEPIDLEELVTLENLRLLQFVDVTNVNILNYTRECMLSFCMTTKQAEYYCFVFCK